MKYKLSKKIKRFNDREIKKSLIFFISLDFLQILTFVASGNSKINSELIYFNFFLAVWCENICLDII